MLHLYLTLRYAFLAKFLVVQEEQSDGMLLDSALADGEVNITALTEYLVGRHPKRVRAAKVAWEAKHDDSLVDKLADSLSEGMLTYIALRMLKGKREVDDEADEEQARAQSAAVIGMKEAGTVNGKAFVNLISDNSAAENRALARLFEEDADMSLRRLIANHFDEVHAWGAIRELCMHSLGSYACIALGSCMHAFRHALRACI